MKNKKAQLALPMYVIIAVFVAGFLLAQFNEPLNAVRENALAQTPSDKVVMRFILYMLIPIIWFFYILLSIFAINAAVQQTV